MPGIFGFIKKEYNKKDNSEYIFSRMTRYLSHMKWYNIDKYISKEFAFGQISINSSSKIRHINHNGKKYILLIDGYIYSVNGKSVYAAEEPNNEFYKNIVVSVTDQSLKDILKIEGNYTIIIYDIDGFEISIISDIIGPKRLYYADLPDMFVVSPEMKAISFLAEFKKDINWKAVSDFFNYGYVLGDDTFFHSIKCLPSASILKFNVKKGSLIVNKYWEPIYSERNSDINSLADEGANYLFQSIREKVRDRDSIICPISGGLDSRFIISSLCEIDKNITIKPVTHGQNFSYEYQYAKKVCKFLGLKNHALIQINPISLIDKYNQAVWLSEGMIPMTNAHLLLHYLELGRNYNCFFNGIYGGPTNYASDYYTINHIEGKFDFFGKTNDIERVIRVKPDFYKAVLNDKLFKSIQDNGSSSIESELKKTLNVSDKFCNQRDYFFIENRMRRLICHSSLTKNFWEEHLPLSNYSLYAFYLSTPPEIKLKRKLLKTMIIRKFPVQAKIDDANTGLNLFQKPTAWYKIRKQAEHNLKYYLQRLSSGKIMFYDKSTYSHYNHWLVKNKETNNFFKKYLFADHILNNGFFNKSKLKEFFIFVNQGKSGFHHLARMATFSIWFELFVLEEGIKEVTNNIDSLNKNG